MEWLRAVFGILLTRAALFLLCGAAGIVPERARILRNPSLVERICVLSVLEGPHCDRLNCI